MAFFGEILQMSLLGGVMIAAVMSVRLLFKRWRTHGFLTFLWLCALVLLLLPFRPSSQASIYNVTGKMPAMAQALAVGVEVTGMAPNVSAEHKSMNILLVIWAVVTCTMLCAMAVTALLLHRRFKHAMPKLVTSVLTAGIRRDVRVYVSARTKAPVTYGILRPKIILPISLDGDRTSELVIKHELQHICGWDALVNLLWLFALCVHWFNPLVWVGWMFLRRDMEARCDATVVAGLEDVRRADYAQALLNAARVRSGKNVLPLALGASTTANRIKFVLDYRPATWRIYCVSFAITLLLVMLLATNPVATVTERIPGYPAVFDSVSAQEYLLFESVGDGYEYGGSYESKETIYELLSSDPNRLSKETLPCIFNINSDDGWRMGFYGTYIKEKNCIIVQRSTLRSVRMPLETLLEKLCNEGWIDIIT